MKKLHTVKKNNFKKCKLYALMFLALPGMYTQAQAQNIYEWIGDVNNNVTNEPGNWRPVGTSSENKAIINSNTSATGDAPTWVLNQNGYIRINGDDVQQVAVGSGGGSHGVLNIRQEDYDGSNYGTVGYLTKLDVGVQGGTGTVNIYHNETYPSDVGGSGYVHITGSKDALQVGIGAGSQGTVNVLGSGKTTEMQQGYAGSALAVETWDQDSLLAVGMDRGRGTINVDGGSMDLRHHQSKFVLGSGTGSTGTLNILGGGKVTDNLNHIMPDDDGISIAVGHNGGHGVINIVGTSAYNGAMSRAALGSGITVGQGNGSLGEVNVLQGAELVTAAGYYWDSVSGDQKPILNQVGVDGGTGRVVVDGQNSIWKVIGETYFTGGMPGDIGALYVGNSGTGEVTVSNGGVISVGYSEYGYNYNPDTNASYYAETDHVGGQGTLYLASQTGSTGIINIGASAGQVAQGVGVLAVKDIEFGDGAGTLVFNHTDTTGNYVFDIPLVSGNGQGTIRQIAGVTVLADQVDYTGDVSVEGGKLLINGTQAFNEGRVSGGILEVNGHYSAVSTQVTGGYLEVLGNVSGPVTVNGGVLSGNGVVGDVTVNSGGTLAPGALLGDDLDVLTVDSAEFNSGSIYQASSNPDRTGDLLYATIANGGSGTVMINGGDVQVVASPGEWAENTKYHIVQTDSGLTGEFEDVTTNLAFLVPTLEYDSMNAYLYLTRNETDFANVGYTYNQRTTGAGVESLGSGNPVYDSVVSMSADQARAAYDNMSGEIHAGVLSGVFLNNRYSRDAVNQHLSGSNTRQQEPHTDLWISTWAHDGHLDSDSNATRLNNKGWGFLIGADAYTDGVTTIGIAAGYEQSRLSAGSGRSSDADVDALHLMGYGRTTVGEVDLQGGIGYSRLSIDTSRDIWVPGLTGENKASYNGSSFQVFAQASHTYEMSDTVALTPYAGLVYQYVKTDGFTENGGATALQRSSDSSDRVSSVVGVNGQWQLNENAQVYAGLGWQHDFGSSRVSTDLNFVGGSQFNVRAPRNGQDSALVDLGAKFELQTNMHLSVGYSGELGSRSTHHAARLLWELRY